jgi:serine/threonine protein kinase
MGITLSDANDGTLPGPFPVLARGGHVFVKGAVLGGAYEIRGLLGEGGMGQVFEAQDLHLNRRVAIKVQWPNAKLPSIRKEAQALAVMQHPSLPSVYAYGVHDGIEYVVMERVYGVSLKERLDRRLDEREAFSVAEVVSILDSVTQALDVVHRAGIVHRDVKPSNIMLAPRGRVVLMDFGTVMAASEAGPEQRLMGTAEYLAPEAIRAQIELGWAHLVDLYALGILGYELLAGSPPYRAATPQSTLYDHLRRPVPDVTAARSDVPIRLASLLTALMAKSPDDRPSDAEEVLHRLRAIDEPAQRSGYDILVVDDHRQLAEALAAAAKQVAPRATTRIATTGDEALRLIDQRCPDLLVVDLELPGVNGLEVCMYLQGTGRRARVLVVSGKAHRPDAQILQQLGVQQLIPKNTTMMQRFREAISQIAPRGPR